MFIPYMKGYPFLNAFLFTLKLLELLKKLPVLIKRVSNITVNIKVLRRGNPSYMEKFLLVFQITPVNMNHPLWNMLLPLMENFSIKILSNLKSTPSTRYILSRQFNPRLGSPSL